LPLSFFFSHAPEVSFLIENLQSEFRREE
jgi:hypothetical protein